MALVACALPEELQSSPGWPGARVCSMQLSSPCIMLGSRRGHTVQRSTDRGRIIRTLRLGLVDDRRLLGGRLRLSQRQQLQCSSGFLGADRSLACNADDSQAVRYLLSASLTGAGTASPAYPSRVSNLRKTGGILGA